MLVKLDLYFFYWRIETTFTHSCNYYVWFYFYHIISCIRSFAFHSFALWAMFSWRLFSLVIVERIQPIFNLSKGLSVQFSKTPLLVHFLYLLNEG